MAKKITQYPASSGNPDVTSLLDISEFDGSIFTTKKIAISQLLTFLNSNLSLGSSFTFKNNTGKTILKGDPVEIDDASGLDLPEVVLIAQSFSRRGLSQVFIATETVLNGNSGVFIQNGFIDIDTTSYPVGTKIFWNISTETYTVLASEIDQVFIGVVTVQSATGQMFVSPVRGLKTLTSQFTNDGDDTINPFITALDLPIVPTLTSDLTNDGADGLHPFITLADLPSSGGGSSVNYYLNGSVNASVATYKQLSNTAVLGVGTDFNLLGNGLITQFLTDIANPNRLEIPGGAWNFEMFFSMSSNGGTPAFYVELLKYDGSTFTSIASNSANPENINGGTSIDLYLTSLAVPTTSLLVTDRLAIRVYIVNNSGGRTATLHTEDNHLCEIITTFAGGVTSLNGLTANTQYLSVGTSGTDFAISSTSDTHTFNLPTASASNRGALSSTDWTTFNNKVGTTRTLTINGTAQDLSADRSWTIASSAIPQANKIYVDSINGVNSTGRGNINNPYLTPEYALSDITNTGTVTATTMNLSATLTAVSSTANIVVGQYITGTGIPYGSTVVSKTSNTIVLSKACTAIGTITATYWTIYEVILNGNFVVTSNIHKTGFYINSKSLGATISYGNLTLFTFTANVIIPFYLSLGKTFGTHANSGLIDSAGFSGIDGFLDLGNYYSICTGFNLGTVVGANYLSFTNLSINTEMFDCRFGLVSLISVSGNFTWNGNAYGLLGGIRYLAGYADVNTKVTTPASVLAINGTASRGNINGTILGSYTHLGGINVYANITGTTASIDSGDFIKSVNVYGSLTVTTVTLGGSPVILDGDVTGNVIFNGFPTSKGSVVNGSINGTVTVNSGSIKFNGNQEGTALSRYMTVIIGAGTFINNGLIRLPALTYTGAGKFVNDGTLITSAATNTSAPIKITNSGQFINNKDLISDNTVDYMPLIEKTDGVLVNNGRMYSPFNMYVRFAVNTAVSKEVILAYAISNGNTYGNSTSGTGDINKFAVSLANTNTVLTIFDGTNTVVISVVGAGKSIAVISAEIVTLVKASILLFQNCSYVSTYGVVVFIPRAGFTATFTVTTNIGSIGTYAGGGGFVGTVLGTGTELLSTSYNY